MASRRGGISAFEIDDRRPRIAGVDRQARHERDSEPRCGEALNDLVVVRSEDDVRLDPGGSEAVQRRSDRQRGMPADERELGDLAKGETGERGVVAGRLGDEDPGIVEHDRRAKWTIRERQDGKGEIERSSLERVEQIEIA